MDNWRGVYVNKDGYFTLNGVKIADVRWGMFNQKLADEKIDFESLGFEKEDDGSGDPRGVDYNYRLNDCHIMIDAWFNVAICKNSCEWIDVKIYSFEDLKNLMDFTK